VRRTNLRLTILQHVGDTPVLVRAGASRWYVHKLAHRYPQYEWTAERVTLHGGPNGAWNIYAKRLQETAA
jgi:hypothetical protein